MQNNSFSLLSRDKIRVILKFSHVFLCHDVKERCYYSYLSKFLYNPHDLHRRCGFDFCTLFVRIKELL